MLGFASACPLSGLRSVAAGTSAGVVCMKTRASKNNRSAKSKRASGTGFGVGVGSGNSNNSSSPSTSQNKSQVSSSSSSSDADAEEEASTLSNVEKASGSTGDSTPHRVNVPQGAEPVLETPSDDIDLPPPEPLVPLPELTLSQKQKLRFPLSSPPDQVIEYFVRAQQTEHFSAVVVANRHMVTDAFLYRFTSAILQTEGRDTDTDTIEEEVTNMRRLRKQLVSCCWSYDYPLKRAVLLAEQRLLDVLKGSNVRRDVERMCGRTRVDVDAFWTVIYAAVAAWEERGRENAELVNVDTQKVLTEAAETCRTSKIVKEYLSESLQGVQEILTANDATRQEEVVKQLDEEMVLELCGFAEAVRLLPTGAYGGLTERLRTIGDYVVKAKFGIEGEGVRPLRFNLQDIRRESRLIEFAKRAMQSRKP